MHVLIFSTCIHIHIRNNTHTLTPHPKFEAKYAFIASSKDSYNPNNCTEVVV